MLKPEMDAIGQEESCIEHKARAPRTQPGGTRAQTVLGSQHRRLSVQWGAEK